MNGRIAVGADHAGLSLKDELVSWLVTQGYQVSDEGAHSYDPDDDYPDYVEPVAGLVASGGAERGIIICGSGVGASVAANKFPGVRAGMCHDTYSAHQGVEHDDVNILCLGARIVGIELAKEVVAAFLSARFTGEERHKRRLEKVMGFESRFFRGGRTDAAGRDC